MQSENFQRYVASTVGSSAGNQMAFSNLSVAASGASSPFRFLTTAQEATAKSVFGDSLDFATIMLSDTSGLGGRPFTLAMEVSGIFVQILNCGTFSPSDSTLIHELAHAWQSQHHSAKRQFMINAGASQLEAAKLNLAEAALDVTLVTESDFPLFYPYDAYAYHPSQPLITMAAEQMASAIENMEGGILSYIRSIPKNAVDPLCVSALRQVNVGDHRVSGVKG